MNHSGNIEERRTLKASAQDYVRLNKDGNPIKAISVTYTKNNFWNNALNTRIIHFLDSDKKIRVNDWIKSSMIFRFRIKHNFYWNSRGNMAFSCDNMFVIGKRISRDASKQDNIIRIGQAVNVYYFSDEGKVKKKRVLTFNERNCFGFLSSIDIKNPDCFYF